MTPKQFEKWIKSIGPEVTDKLNRVMIEGANKIKKDAMDTVSRNSHNTGNLLNHIEIWPLFKNKIATEVIIGTTVPYAPYVEYGSGPHRSGVNSAQFRDELKRWCELHGLPFYPVYRKIVRFGIKEKPFLVPAYNKFSNKILRAIEKVLKEID